MEDGRLKGQEDKLYVVIAYNNDMQIFICNRDVFLLRLSQKYGIPEQNIGFYDFELENNPSAMIDIKDIRDGMILKMVDILKLPKYWVKQETSNVSYESAIQEDNNPEAFASLPKEEDNIARAFALPFKKGVKIAKTTKSSPMKYGNLKRGGKLMPSTSTSQETPRINKVKVSFRMGSDAESNLTKIPMKKVLYF